MLTPIDFFNDLLNPDLRFLPKALVVALMASVVSGVIGTYVVLRGMAFIGDAVAHAVFPGLAVAFVIQGNLVLGGAVAGVLTAVLVAVFSQNRRMKEDSVIGVFFVGAFALGIVIIAQAPGYAGSLQQFLFGSITGIPDEDVLTVAITGAVLLLAVWALHKEFVAVTLDREMARAVGLPVFVLDLALYVMVAVAIVISIQTIGNILVLALLITPAAAARLLTDRLGLMMLLAPAIGGLSAVVGLYLSWSIDLPAGGTIVLVATLVFLLAWLFAPRHGLLVKYLRRMRGARAIAGVVAAGLLVTGVTLDSLSVLSVPAAAFSDAEVRPGAESLPDPEVSPDAEPLPEPEVSPAPGASPEAEVLPEPEPLPDPEASPEAVPVPVPDLDDASDTTLAPEAAVIADTQNTASPRQAQAQTRPPATHAAATPGVALPAQSHEPAPQPRTKRVFETVHTDAVSAFLDGGKLAADSKADVDGALGKRFASREVLFHLNDNAKEIVPDAPAFSFLGKAGDSIWLAPQIQKAGVLWPGFSTEDPALRGNVDGATLSVRLLSVTGPGIAEVFLQDGPKPTRVFSSETTLPAWRIGVPQHTHMNWAFSKAGSYNFTFEYSGKIGGKTQTAANQFTFVVGDLAKHTVSTNTKLTLSRASAPAGEAVTFTARVAPAGVAPAGVAGAVQFRDRSRDNVVLGHSPVSAGDASFRLASLTPGPHDIVAEFVPSWSNDYRSSRSSPARITVEGEVRERPTAADTKALTPSELDRLAVANDLRLSMSRPRVLPGETVTAALKGAKWRGEWVSLWLHSKADATVGSAVPRWLGWVEADLEGNLKVQLPTKLAAGEYWIVAKDRDGRGIGRDTLQISAIPKPPPPDNQTSNKANPKPPAPPTPPPPAAPNECAPPLVLETGHIDAFNVSAGAGQAVLQIKEDVTGHQVIREAETVLLRVKPEAYVASMPAGTPGGPSGYVLPLTQNSQLIWPGWDTNRTSSSGFSDVTISVNAVDGPGTVSVYTQGSFGDWKPILTHGGMALPGSIREPTPAHTHAQWVFSEAGIYTLAVSAVASNPKTGQTLGTANHSYVFQVGDVPLGDTFCKISPVAADAGARVQNAVAEAAAAAVASVAAEQAKLPKLLAGRGNAGVLRGADIVGSGQESRAEPNGELRASGLSGGVIAGVVGGGSSVLAGIGGVTWWALRRVSVVDGPPEESELMEGMK